MKSICVAIMLTLGWAMVANAEQGWATVGSIKAAEGKKEISVNKQVSKVAIICTDGVVTITAFSVKDGVKTTPYSFTSRLNKGESQQVTIGDKVNVAVLIIHDDGKGSYDVKVK